MTLRAGKQERDKELMPQLIGGSAAPLTCSSAVLRKWLCNDMESTFCDLLSSSPRPKALPWQAFKRETEFSPQSALETWPKSGNL